MLYAICYMLYAGHTKMSDAETLWYAATWTAGSAIAFGC